MMTVSLVALRHRFMNFKSLFMQMRFEYYLTIFYFVIVAAGNSEGEWIYIVSMTNRGLLSQSRHFQQFLRRKHTVVLRRPLRFTCEIHSC